MGQLVKEVSEIDFARQILQNELPCVVDFWGDRCPPCVLIAPVLEELASDFAGKIAFFKIKAADNPDITASYGITAVPTLLLFKDGKILSRFIGAVPKPQLAKFLEPALV